MMIKFISIFTIFILNVILASSSSHNVNDNTFFKNTTFSQEDKDMFELFLPEKNIITLKETILFKGFNRLQTPVFVDSTLLEVRNDGRFYFDYNLKDYGKNALVVTFVTDDDRKYQELKKVLYLKTPNQFDDSKNHSFDHVYFYNSPYIRDSNISLSAPFTRLDMAYFLYKLQSPAEPNDINEPNETSILDESEFTGFEKYVDFILKENIMTLYPDNSFKPNKPVSRIEYIISLVKTLDLAFVNSDLDLPFSDIEPDHWTTNYLRSAFHHDLLLKRGEFAPNEQLSIASFIEHAVLTTPVRAFIEDLLDFSIGYHLDDDYIKALNESNTLTLNSYKEKIKNSSKLTLSSPQPGAIVLGNTVPIKGSIYPTKEFMVNDLKVTPDLYGNFELILPLSNGANNFQISAFEKQVSLNVYSLTPFMDLNNHWISKTAAKLRHLDLIDSELNFNADKPISREYLSHLLVKSFNLTAKEDAVITQPFDLNLSNMYFDDILVVLGHNILSVDEENKFNPSQVMTKSEALTTVVRVIDSLNDVDYQLSDTVLPFKDVSSSHWVYPALQKAQFLNIVSPSNYFFPSKIINKAEFVALLSKVPMIDEQLKGFFK